MRCDRMARVDNLSKFVILAILFARRQSEDSVELARKKSERAREPGRHRKA